MSLGLTAVQSRQENFICTCHKSECGVRTAVSPSYGGGGQVLEVSVWDLDALHGPEGLGLLQLLQLPNVYDLCLCLCLSERLSLSLTHTVSGAFNTVGMDLGIN